MRILVIHPRLQPPGGGEAVGAWTLQALQSRHEVTLATTRPVDWGAIDRYYGTAIDPRRVRVALLPRLRRLLVDVQPTTAALVEGAVHFRWARSLAPEHDLILSTSNEWDFGRPGIQYIHFPRMYLPRPDHDLRWYHLGGGMVRAYTRLCLALGGVDPAGVARNLTLANSAWTARHFEARHGGEARVLYPPVPGDFPEVPWDERTAGFLIVGRISPEKRIEDAVEIVRRVREAGHDVRLDVVGAPGDPAYVARVRGMVERDAAWLGWHTGLARAEYARLLATRRFGIHAMRDEHFGIAVAELLRAGCVPFVPTSGGPREIVGEDPALLFGSVEEGVARVRALLESPSELAKVRLRLEARRGLFGVERFMAELLAAVESFGSPG